MNIKTNLINLFVQDLRSINATLRDITPATVSNDIATTKITGLIKKWEAYFEYLSTTINFEDDNEYDVVVNYEALAEHEAQTFDEPTVVLATDKQDDKCPRCGEAIEYHEHVHGGCPIQDSERHPYDGVPADTTKGGQL